MQLQGNNTDPIKHMRPDMGSVTTEHATHRCQLYSVEELSEHTEV